MQNLKNQPSVSGSPNQNETQPHPNGNYIEIPAPPQHTPIVEPEFLGDDVPITSPNEIKIPVEPLEAPAQHLIPSPEESTVKEPEYVSRSWRMQWRFWRTLVYAGLLFIRILFWQVYVAQYLPDYVKKNELKRWVKYSRGFRKFAIAQGGVFIKLGQFISTRVDILPAAIIKELESLQDEVPTIPFKQIKKVVEDELGALEARYSWFNPEPIAAASLGQVHRAKLLDGTRVVVKVQRPNIRTICYTDLAAMRIIAKIAMRFQFISRRADAVGLVEEFGAVLLEELSYKHEAYNAARFAEMFKHDPGVYIPTVYYEHSTDQVLTIEDVTSIKITDFEAMEKAGINRKQVAKRLMDTYLKQVFDEYFFHADPHPGNLFVYPLPVEDITIDFGVNGRPFYLIFVDFGMTGTLTHEIADGMVTTLYSVLTRDVEGLVKSYQRLGFLLPGADIPRIIEAARAAFDQVWGLSMMELKQVDYDKMVDLAEEFSDLMRSMPFYIPQDFIYLGRTISILSGMCTSLDPLYNPWYDLQPYTEKLIARGFGVDIPRNSIMSRPQMSVSIIQSLFSGNGVQILRAVGEEVIRRTIAPVSRADDALRKLEKGELRIVTDLSLPHRQQLKRIEKENRATSRAVFFGSVLIASTLFYTHGDTTIAVIGYVICGVTWIMGSFRR
ncbi:MAG: hypothetical protein CUN56_10190 [Phototrophicales bacterium]|nr:MAG: hypothetical protein CUN56_10190 [Phototrophicales bacterium]